MTVVTKRVNLGRRAAWAVGIVLGLGVLTLAMCLLSFWWAWGSLFNLDFDPFQAALSNAIAVMSVTGLVAFVYVGMSFGRWLSQRLEKPVQPQFEATEYPRAPLEAR